jgi:two-component system sensor histidine kinase YesM
MGEIKIPKLSLQPIIENSLKYAFMKKPPWHISVRGYLDRDAGKWFITITDNGVGFKEEELQELAHTLESIRDSKDITRLKIGGMGLQNVYLRLLLQYGPSASLTAENHPEGGACITMGGSITNDRNS